MTIFSVKPGQINNNKSQYFMSFIFSAGTEPMALSIAELNPYPANILKQAFTFLYRFGNYTYSMNLGRQLKHSTPFL